MTSGRSYKYVALFFLGLIVAGVGIAGSALAEQVEIVLAQQPPITIRADRVEALGGREIYEAFGNVRIERGDEVLTADQARINTVSQVGELKGGVRLETSDVTLVCQRMVLNFEYNLGKIYDGTAFFPENHYYISGDEIERTGPDTFVIKTGRATACDGPTPAWTLSGRNIKIKREGWASASHATFKTRYFPLMYLPWMTLPVRTKRQSGFLVPSATHSSRDGVTATFPLYWAISDSQDLTLYFTGMEKRGLETTLEYRYEGLGGKGVFMGTYLNDHDPPTVVYDSGPKEIRDRYWLRGMADAETKSGFKIKMDLDYASDPKFLDEFNRSVTGYQASRRLFLGEFGREPAESLDPLRKSIVQATKSVSGQELRASLEYTQDLDKEDNLGTIQRLPRIGLDLTRTRIPGTLLWFNHSSEYTYFARRTDNDSPRKEQGHRLDLFPRVFWPIQLSKYLNLEPSIGVRETLYHARGLEPGPQSPDARDYNYRLTSRTHLYADVTAWTEISRVYDLNWGPIQKIKHRVKPEVALRYRSGQEDDHLPYWDPVDRIDRRRSITYGLVTYLVAKMNRQGRYPRVKSKTERSRIEYVEFLRLGLHRSYDFVEADRQLDPFGPSGPLDERRPHSPWTLEAEFNLPPYFWGKATTMYETYSDMFTGHVLELQARDRRGDYLYLSYELNKEPFLHLDRYQREYEEIRGILNLAVNEQLNFQVDRRESLIGADNAETTLALDYNPQCWGVRLEYTNRPDETLVAVYFSLKGLGKIGSYTHSLEPAPAVETEDETRD